MLEITKQLKYDENGLIPAVVQDYKDGTILMVAYMNAEAFEKTLKTNCILLKVIQVGDSACHTGYRSCFYRKLSFTGNTRIVGKKIFDPKKVYGK